MDDYNIIYYIDLMFIMYYMIDSQYISYVCTCNISDVATKDQNKKKALMIRIKNHIIFKIMFNDMTN